MKKVILLKEYQEKPIGSIIEVSNNVAFGLIESKIARASTNKDFLIKSEFGQTKAFRTAPSKGGFRKRK